MSVFNTAKYILEQLGPMSAMKLQKLCFYSQAWHMVWEDEPLFEEDFQAWANGPVCPDLYQEHRGKFRVSSEDITGLSGSLTENESESIDQVLKFYGDKSGQWLSDLTHSETPWLERREGLENGERSNRIIRKDKMADYYASL